MDVFTKWLGERGVEKRHDGNVEPIEPYHRLIAIVPVIVPGPRWRNHEIPFVHERLFALYRRVRAIAFDDEAQRRLRVSVRRGDFAGQDKLKTGIQ